MRAVQTTIRKLTRFNLPGEICPYLLIHLGSASEGLDLTWSKLLPGRYKHPTLSCFILGCTCVGARYNGLKVVLLHLDDLIVENLKSR